MRIVLTLVLVLATAACAVPRDTYSNTHAADDDTTLPEAARTAPAKVQIRGRWVSLSASLWRDCMPSIDAKGCRPVSGVLAVTADDGKAFPNGMRIDRVWLVHDRTVWETTSIEEQDAGDPGYVDASGTPRNRPGSASFRIALRNGPEWDIDAKVEVVVRLVGETGECHYLRVTGQQIERIS